jgi:outer membrane protein OmpA-like peptidoglycan-associated protein
MNIKAFLIVVLFSVWVTISTFWYVTQMNVSTKNLEQNVQAQQDTVINTQINTDTIVAINTDTLNTHTVVEPKTLVEFSDKAILYFESYSQNLEPDSIVKSYLKSVAKKLIKNTDTTITLMGHTDNLGDGESNWAKSIYHAKDVRKYLVNLGAPYYKIKVDGRGESEPLIKDTTQLARDKNRRIELFFNK